MNAKKCKKLRRLARKIGAQWPARKETWLSKRNSAERICYMKRNDPSSVRGVYRYMKAQVRLGASYG